jgi:hypothetical protein
MGSIFGGGGPTAEQKRLQREQAARAARQEKLNDERLEEEKRIKISARRARAAAGSKPQTLEGSLLGHSNDSIGSA